MTEKELKKLTRMELLEMLIDQSREVERLRGELEAAKKELEEKQIKIERSGSIAQAALALSGVFEKAQEAADLYLANIKLKGSSTDDEKA